MADPAIRAYGEAAWMVELDPQHVDGATAFARAIAEAVEADGSAGWGRAVPAYDTVLVPFDPEMLEAAAAATRLAALVRTVRPSEGHAAVGRAHSLDVRYGGDDGPDLATAAEALGLTPSQLVDAHAALTFDVLVLGFAPGFAYLGTLPVALRLPRRASPRPRVPAGSVAIAGDQCAIYPGGTAGGWHCIGRTDAVVWDVRRARPALLLPGDTVRFEPIRD